MEYKLVHKMKAKQFPPNRQSGAALIVALIFLLLMTLLSTSSMRTSTMQERMSGNMRDWNLGFQSAEAALREAEQHLLDDTDVLPEFDDTNGYYQINSPDKPVWVGPVHSVGAGSIVYEVDRPDLAEQPRYYIEKLSSVRPAGSNTETGTPVEEFYYFRVTAIGYGAAEDDDGSPLTAVVLNSVYRSR